MHEIVKHYSNNDITITWKPDTCIHSRICWTQLRSVFDPTKRPWIEMSGADTQTIIDQVRRCPSGALSYHVNDGEEKQQAVSAEVAEIVNIRITPNGPIIVNTDCRITHRDGSEEIKKGTTALCRCGASQNKPYCDGSHNKTGFQG